MRRYDIAVIGAGAFGSWIAWHLGRGGRSVLLADAWAPAHSRSSSGGESRVIRMGYGANALYTSMARRSLALWQELFQRTGQPLFHHTGVLWIARESDPHSEANRATLRACGVPIEMIPGDELARRYPQMRVTDPRAFGILEPESGALMARRAVAAVVAEAVKDGVTYVTEAVRPPAGSRRVESLETVSGNPIHADVYVIACGPWLPKIFPDLLSRRIYPTRQEVFFFAQPAGDNRFTASRLPVWIDFTDPRGPYGFPDLEGRGFKLAFDRHGAPFDPDEGDRCVSSQSVSDARQFLADRFPALRDAPLAECRVCQYENTSNGDFLIDRHPDMENVWLAGGGSGHGFKHGPAVGEYVCARVVEGGAVEPRFSLASKQQTQMRTVY